jgi:hypothetical protein
MDTKLRSAHIGHEEAVRMDLNARMHMAETICKHRVRILECVAVKK